MKKYPKDQFFDENLNAQRNWDEYILKTAKEEAQKDPHPHLPIDQFIEDNTIPSFSTEEEEEEDFTTELWYSNDSFLNTIMLHFIDNVDEKTSHELRKFFIGKLGPQKSPNAEARNRKPEIDEGYLITYNFTLDFGISRLTEVYASYIHYKGHIGEYKKQLGELLLNNYMMLFNLEKFNPAYKRNLPVHIQEQYNESSYKHYFGATAFVVAHEIGHHLLKHTVVKEDSMMITYKNDFIDMIGTNIDHEYEFAADDFAVDFFLKDKRYELYNKERKIDLNYLTSPLYVMLALALDTNDPTAVDGDHPPIRDRYLKLLSKLSNYCTEGEIKLLKEIFRDIVQGIQDMYKPWIKVWWE